MPIFEYSCAACAHRFEKVQKVPDEQEIACPACGSTQVKKELSTFSTGSSCSPSCSTGGG
jgi:putative FmdB family regulatory protein